MTVPSSNSCSAGKQPRRGIYRQIVNDKERNQFHNKAAFGLTVFSMVLLGILSLIYRNESASEDIGNSSSGRYYHRLLEQNGGDDDNNDGGNDNTDFSEFSCRYIYDQFPNPGEGQCNFASTCNGGEGVWAAFVFCSNTFSTKTLFLILSPVMLVWMMILFRLLGTTAEDYFSPSLEMFSVKLGLPPRFAGVSLLALGNGAADVSATMSAIVNDAENGYRLSLGALSGAAMLVGGVIAGIIVLIAGGVPCRGALVRDITALIVTILLVWRDLSTGEIGPKSITLYLSLYVLFVCLVLVADIYHRAVVLPRLAAARGEGNPEAEQGEATPPENTTPSAISRVISAFSDYDNPTPDQQGAAQELEDENIILHGRNGLLHGGGLASPNSLNNPETMDENGGVYALVDNHMDQICVGDGEQGVGAANWKGGFYDCKQEIIQHFNETWEDAVWNGDNNVAEKIMLICEFPFTVLRKATISIPCEGYYNRGIIALSIALSPLWSAFYMYKSHDTNVFAKDWIVIFLPFWGLSTFVAVLLVRYAPADENSMSMWIATPIALYGFIIAATWIDYIADCLVGLLDFMGIVLHIPGAIMGLTILAWGNSMADLSANVTMARKGLANMAITACCELIPNHLLNQSELICYYWYSSLLISFFPRSRWSCFQHFGGSWIGLLWIGRSNWESIHSSIVVVTDSHWLCLHHFELYMRTDCWDSYWERTN